VRGKSGTERDAKLRERNWKAALLSSQIHPFWRAALLHSRKIPVVWEHDPPIKAQNDSE